MNIRRINSNDNLSDSPIDIRQEQLRQLRNDECYPIVNRGELWYKKLSQEQLNQLDKWYIAWLDVTKTLVIPEKPKWL